MGSRVFEVTVVSANDIRNVRKLGKMEVHARVSVGGGDQTTEMRTPSDRHGLTNPAWHHTMQFTINDTVLEHHNAALSIKLYCDRILGDRYIGEVNLMVRDLYNQAYHRGLSSPVTAYPIQRGAANSQGLLKLSYRFGPALAHRAAA